MVSVLPTLQQIDRKLLLQYRQLRINSSSSFGFFVNYCHTKLTRKNYRLIATFWFLFGIFVHCEMQQSWAKKTLKNFHRIYSIHFYIQQQLSVIFFYHDNLTKSIYYSLAHFRSAHVMIPNKVPLKVLWRALFTK